MATSEAISSGARSKLNKRSPNPLLFSFYNGGNNKQVAAAAASMGDEESGDPLDIDRPHFNPDFYKAKLFKESTLTDLIDRKSIICKQIVELDSEMKTLVYENYNKFISATDTIRKMKNDFCKMEDEMDCLATNMSSITEFSGKISNTLQDRRQQINKLSNVHLLLKKLQFLFELPSKLNACIEDGEYARVVRYYLKAQKALKQYQHMPSFQGIHKDCNEIIVTLKSKLREQFQDNDATPKQLADSIDLLLQLNEPVEDLCEEFLANAHRKLTRDLSELESQVELQAGEGTRTVVATERPSDAYLSIPLDILAFTDLGCNQFLSNICLVVAAYEDMFFNSNKIGDGYSIDENIQGIAMKKLINFVMNLMETYFSLVQRRVTLEKDTGDNVVLVRALDRFHRRLQSLNSLLPDSNFARIGTDIVSKAASERCLYCLNNLKQHFNDCLTDVRQALVSSRPSSSHETSLPTLLEGMIDSLKTEMRSALSNLQAFVQVDISFSTKAHFRQQFCCSDIREGLIVAFFHHVNELAMDFCNGAVERGNIPPPLMLLLSSLCLDFSSSTIAEMLSLTEVQFVIERVIKGSTTASDLSLEAKDVAQRLVNHYVHIQGLAVSQMLRKSVETRDWMNTIEPRTVRAVMKRVVEDITAIDVQVGQLYEEGTRKERSSDSSRRAVSHSTARQNPRSNWSSYAPSTLDDSLLSNIHKLFSERIEIFSSVEFSKVSILTGIVKISLKTLLECVRLRTFGRYGLQQIQVDTHYLQEYLWRFVSDEHLVDVLLDEILSSTIYRCLDPVLMETSVVKAICERG